MSAVLKIIFFFSLISYQIQAADNYQIGDTLFIWARSGLNLRENPSTKSETISKLPIGEALIIIGETNIPYNTCDFSKVDTTFIYDKKIDPIIFKGHWTKVQTLDGKRGYVIDQYLLSLRPFRDHIPNDDVEVLKLEMMSFDTVYQNIQAYSEGEGLFLTTKKAFNDDIYLLEDYYAKFQNKTYFFTNFSIEEVLILMIPSLADERVYIVMRNWEQEIILSKNGAEIKIKQEGNTVKFTWTFSC